MTETQSRRLTGKNVALVIIAAIATAVVVTLVQVALRGNSNPAVTGAVTGAITAVLAIGAFRKTSS